MFRKRIYLPGIREMHMNRSGKVSEICLAAILAGVLTALAPLRAGRAAETTTAPAKAPAKAAAKAAAVKALAGYIQVIKTDKDPSVVLRAYTKACALNRMDPELNSVYMRRMLLLGRPSAAYISARILSSQDADAGLAWAVIGYMNGRSNKYLTALTATARALEFNSDDPSILNNAGQLAAWFDNAPGPPKLGDREKRIMDKLKGKFAKSKEYTDAYNRVNTTYVTTRNERKELQAKLTAAETEYNKVRTEELTMRATIKRINSQMLQLNKRLKQLDRDLQRNRNLLNVRDAEGRYIYNQRAILAEHARIQKDIDNARSKKDALRKEGAPIVPKIHIATAQGRKLRKNISGYRTTLQGVKPAILRQLRWDPPAVDGVFTSEAINPPHKIKPTTRPKVKIVDTSPEAAAAKKLKLAKLYVAHEKFGKAREIIAELIEKHPNTKAAAQAQALLKIFPPETPAQ